MLSRRVQVLINTITKLLRKNAHQRLYDIAQKVHAADLAVAFRFLNDEQQDKLFSLITDPEQRAELLENLDETIGRRLILDYSNSEIADIIQFMADDEAIDLIQELEEGKIKTILNMLKKDDREDLEELIGHDEDTAGGLMTTEFIEIPSTYNASEVLEEIQKAGDEAEIVFYVYASDEDGRLEGVASLREIVQSDDDTPLTDFMETDLYKVYTDTDQEDVAKVISRYDLLAVPVVDEENRMVGVVTVDDIIDVIREEETEDIMKLVGSGEDVLDDYSVKNSLKSRAPWLMITWVGGLLITKLIGTYEDELSKVVALAAFIPIILGMSGNVGQQSATIIVRGLAIGKVNVSHLSSTIGKETLTGLIIGVVYGLALSLFAAFQFSEDSMLIPVIVGLSQAAGMTSAAILGATVPMILSRFSIDPAVATGPLVTTSLDLIAMWIYMTIATFLLF